MEPEDKAFLIERVRRGEAVLILGAGASHGTLDRRKRPLMDGGGLAAHMARALGYGYNDEPLPEVVSAYISKMGREPFEQLLKTTYSDTTPSPELRRLVKYTWRRMYTWNIDDAVEEAARRSPQRAKIYNGMSDKVQDELSLATLQIIHLHGFSQQPDKGFIFSEREYSATLQAGAHPWYKKLINDYRAYCPIFIGSSMREPVLAAELERAALQRGRQTGLAFLVSPDQFTPIRKAALKDKNFVHVQGTLTEFLDILDAEFGGKWEPSQALAATSAFDAETLQGITRDDLEAAQNLKPVSAVQAQLRFGQMGDVRRAIEARNFLRGFPPTWPIASSDVPIALSGAKGLCDSMLEAIKTNEPLFVTLGPAGSGKSTSTMAALLKVGAEHSIDVFEMSPDAINASKIINVLSQISSRRKIVFLPVLYLYSSIIESHLNLARQKGITFISTSRSSEWASHLGYLFDDRAVTFEVSRFGADDYDPLIDRLKSYVPSPEFILLDRREQRERLRRSNSQLLVALREVTESRNFDEIVLDEYQRLPAGVAKRVFVLIGLATLCRVGIRQDMIVEALEKEYGQDDVLVGLNALQGITYSVSSKRLFIRHEFYVRKVFERAVSFELLKQSVICLLRNYQNYKLPISRNVNRSDAILFRYLLNHDFIGELVRFRADKAEGRTIYEAFEVPFQLDGHFWLQYGLFVSDLGDTPGALEKLEKSIQAYPDNGFARHALAATQLRYAGDRASFDQDTIKLVEEAVASLRFMIDSPQTRSDQYPLVTLSLRHTGVLIKHGKVDRAKKVAETYLAELQRAERAHPSAPFAAAKECMIRYLALGTYEPPELFKDNRGLSGL